MALESILTPRSIILKALICIFLVKTTSSYIEMGLNNGNVCKLDYDIANIKLRGAESSVVVIRDGGYFGSWTGRYDFSCKFVIKVKDRDEYDEGIYAVIQELNFRKDENSGECKDYVEFSVPSKDITKLLGLRNRHTRRFCGAMSPGMWLPPGPDDDSREEVDLSIRNLAPNAYIAPGGEVAVEIYISRDRLQPRQKLVVSLGFTAYKKGCYENDKNAQLTQCRIGECIFSELVDDGIQNCPYTSCADEKGCAALRQDMDDEWPKDLVGSGIGTKVTFGAVAAIILIILKFALCLWVCKRLHRRRAPRPQPEIRHHVVLPAEPIDGDCPLPTAPLPPSAEPDTKDMPPSYDSLFPTPRPADPPRA